MRIIPGILIVLVAVCAGCQTSRALKGPIPASQAIGIDDERTDRIGKAIRETMRKEKIPGLSIAVVEHGTTIWAQGFGWRDVKRRFPVDTDTQFQAGSISKPLTALGVLDLKSSGEVDLDTNVNVSWQRRTPDGRELFTSECLAWHLGRTDMADAFTKIFFALRAILQRHAGKLVVSENSPTRFCLEGGVHPKHKTPMPIAWVEIGRNYVSFHHMGVYARPDLLKGVSKKLRARMQGKSCFNFISVDDPLFAELEDLTVCAFEAFQKLPYTR